jgi:CIC family chloride channel protein
MFSRLKSQARQWLNSDANRDRQIMLVLSLMIGAMVGLVIVAFILLTGRLAARMYPPGGAAWRRVLIPTVGALATGILLAKYFPTARGSGIPQTKYALFIHEGYISLRTVIGKFLCCSASLASGIALGREGPSVQIGAGIASLLGRRTTLSPENLKALIPVGCSAALAAAFNTPIAAVLFALEEILGDLHAPVLGSVVISSATSWMVLHLILGDEPLFHVPAYRLVHPVEFAFYSLLGVAGGLASVGFVKLLLRLREFFRRLPKSTLWAQPVAGGLMVGLLGWFLPEILGVGYDYVERVLGGDLAIKTVALLAVLKIVATATCYSSGNAGGIFGPSLFIGAMVGGTVGSIAHALMPGQTANPGAYALIGMGTAFAGIVRTPLTSVIMIFEMTREYSIIVPLMISNLISYFVSYRLQRQPIYEALAHQEGVYLPAGEAREHLASMRVSHVMEPASTVPPDVLLETLNAALKTPRHALPVTDGTRIVGLLSGPGWTKAPPGATASQFASPDYPYVHPDHPLSLALQKMGDHLLDALPVVSRADISRLLGTVTLDSILHAYGVGVEPPESTEAL